MPSDDQLSLAFETRSLHGREDYILAPCNAAAVALIDCWPDWPAPIVAIYGDAGCGKNHLAAIWRAASGATAISPEDAPAVAADLLHVPPATNTALVLRTPDTGFDSRREEEEILHLLNAVRERGAFLLLIGRTAPARLAVGLPDLQSRIRAAPAVEIETPGDDLLRDLLKKMFQDRQLIVSGDVVDYLLPRMERSFDGARVLVDRLDKAALSGKRAVTIPLARRIFGE